MDSKPVSDNPVESGALLNACDVRDSTFDTPLPVFYPVERPVTQSVAAPSSEPQQGMNQNSRRFRVSPTPEQPGEIEFARVDPRWPTFDVMDPPRWLADTGGKIMTREFFDGVRPALAREGYEFNNAIKAWCK